MRTRITTNKIIIGGILLILLVFAMRLLSGIPVVPDSIAYDTLARGQMFMEGDVEFSENGNMMITPYTLIIALLSSMMPFSIVHVLLSLMFAGITLWLGSKLLNDDIALSLIALSPTFIVMSLLHPAHLMAITVFLGAMLMYEKRRLSSVSLLLLFSLFSIVHAAAALSFLIYKMMTQKERPIVPAALITGVLLLAPLPLFPVHWLPSARLESFFHGLGGLFGFSIFFFILASMGIFFGWTQKKKLKTQYILTVLLFVSFFFLDQQILIYLLFPLAFFASFAVKTLLRQKWIFPQVKKLTLLLLLLGVIFSTITAVKTVAEMGPASLESYLWLDTQQEGVVTTAPDEAALVEALTHHAVMASGRDARLKRDNSRDLTMLFETRSLLTAKDILQRHEVEYVLITDRMKAGGVWKTPDEGFLFLLRNNETFKKAYSDGSDTIWKVRHNDSIR